MNVVLRLLCVGAVVAAVMLPAVALAQQYPTPSSEPTVTIEPASHGTGTPQVAEPGRGTLAFTGGELALLTMIGVGAIGAGVVLVRLGGRRRRGLT